MMDRRRIFIDPSSSFFANGRLFDLSDRIANRDDVLLPFSRLRELLAGRGVVVETADALFDAPVAEPADYYSLGIASNYDKFIGHDCIRLRAFIIYEPPVVAPHLYRLLPELTRHFERVYVHNTHGDGYSLDGVDRNKLRKLYFPQPYQKVVEQFWSRTDRLNKLVVINGNKRPRSKRKELYSKRIEAVAQLAKWSAVDLYGPGWDRFLLKTGRFRYVLYMPALLNHKALISANQGPCQSKYETLSHYRFCLCFENMEMDGYITEKLFDCLYAGTIPIYWGAPDIADHIDPACFIDARQFKSYEDLWQHVSHLDEAAIGGYRQAGKYFLASESFKPFYEALPRVLEDGQ